MEQLIPLRRETADRTPTARPRPLPVPQGPELVEEPAPPAVEMLPELVAPTEAVPVVLEEHLTRIVLGLLGTNELSLENLSRVESMAQAAQHTETARQRISARLQQLQDSVDEAGFERDLAREELAIEQRERADAEEQRAEAERRLRHVRKELAVLGRADVAWSEADVDIRDVRPDTFVGLLARLTELEHLVFTGDDDVTLDLDKHGNARSWAGKVWDALLALDDYARISVDGGFAGDVSAYLADTCRTFSANRHASTESEDVQRNPRYRKPRELRVPVEVDPSGGAFMGAHFKIAQSATIARACTTSMPRHGRR